jgi:hypothetical protein
MRLLRCVETSLGLMSSAQSIINLQLTESRIMYCKKKTEETSRSVFTLYTSLSFLLLLPKNEFFEEIPSSDAIIIKVSFFESHDTPVSQRRELEPPSRQVENIQARVFPQLLESHAGSQVHFNLSPNFFTKSLGSNPTLEVFFDLNCIQKYTIYLSNSTLTNSLTIFCCCNL